MPWKIYERKMRRRKEATEARLAIIMQRSAFYLRIYLTEEMAQRLGPRVSVALGEGEHAGWIRLAPSQHEYAVSPASSTKPYSLGVRVEPPLARHTVPAHDAIGQRWEDGALYLLAPAAFFEPMA